MNRRCFDVKSELNPEYLKTGHMCDYYGIYHVYEIDANGEPIGESYDKFLDRHEAYELVRKLNDDLLLP